MKDCISFLWSDCFMCSSSNSAYKIMEHENKYCDIKGQSCSICTYNQGCDSKLNLGLILMTFRSFVH